MFAQLRAFFFKKALRQLLSAQHRTRKVHTLDSAKTIAVLFDASSNTFRREVVDFIKTLENDGKKIKLFGFFNTRQAPESQPFDFFSLKETSWTGQPKSEKATSFSTEKFDLLLSFNPDELAQLDWMGISSQAAMKIGMATEHLNDFDIQLETPEGKGIHFFMEQLSIYLDKIVLTKS